MASVYDLKPGFQKLLRPLARRLVRAGVTPNQVTVAALLLSIAAGAAVLLAPGDRRALLAIPVVLLLRMALNALDGMMAREHDLASPLGALLNELGDVASDAALYLPLAVVPGVPAMPVIAIAVLAALGEMTGVLAEKLCGERRYDGPMGKSDRAVVFGALALALGLGVGPRSGGGWWLPALLAAVILLSLLTIANRGRAALRALQGPPR